MDNYPLRSDPGKLEPVTFSSRGRDPLQLQGLLHPMAGEGQWPAAVVCHPHPLGGGTMYNAVVAGLARSLAARGVIVLRFNFRGVGRSSGQYDLGRGEQADVAGALDWLLAQPGVDPARVAVVGYSFGAWVALAHAQTDARVTATAAVALVAWRYDALAAGSNGGLNLGEFCASFMQSFTRLKLFVSGEHDAFTPPRALRRLVDRLPPPKALHILPGTDHFFQGCEGEVGRLVADYIAGL